MSNLLNYDFVWGATYTNKGSEAMLTALNSITDNKLIMAADFISDLDVENKNVDVILAPKGILDYLFFAFNSILYVVFGFSHSRYIEIFSCLTKCNRVIDLSGFALSEDFSKNSCTYRSTVYLIQAFISKIVFKKNYYIYPQAVGPIKRYLNTIIIFFIMIIADKKYIRGERSFNYVSKLSKKSVVKTTDIVFILDEKRFIDESSAWSNAGNYVVVNPNSRIFHKELKTGNNNYIKSVKNIIDELLNKNYKVVLSPNEVRDNEFDDLDLCETIKKDNYFSNSLVIINYDVTLTNLFEMVYFSNFCVLSRFHLMIFALMCEKPLIVASWSEKYLDIMEEFNLGDFCTSDHNSILSLIEKLELNYLEINNQIKITIPKIRRKLEIDLGIKCESNNNR